MFPHTACAVDSYSRGPLAARTAKPSQQEVVTNAMGHPVHSSDRSKRPFCRHSGAAGARALTAVARRRRRRRNAITACGHFLSLVVQTLLVGAVALLHIVFQRDIGIAFWYIQARNGQFRALKKPYSNLVTPERLSRSLYHSIDQSFSSQVLLHLRAQHEFLHLSHGADSDLG